MAETEVRIAVHFRLCRGEDLRALEWMGLHTREREIIEGAFAAQERGDGLMLLGLSAGFPVAQAWIDFAGPGRAACPLLWAVRVFPALQGAGLGTRLMQEAERRMLARGAREAELGVERDNLGARRFYERLGYRAAGARREVVRYSFEGYPLSDELDQVILRKALRPAGSAAGGAPAAIPPRFAPGAECGGRCRAPARPSAACKARGRGGSRTPPRPRGTPGSWRGR